VLLVVEWTSFCVLVDVEAPSALLWTLYFSSQHYDYIGNAVRGVELVDEALKHTPTMMDLYMLKARILKHVGDHQEAFELMDTARRMDTADRYLNTKTVRFAWRAGQVKKAESIVSLFLRVSQTQLVLINVARMVFNLQ
jgi:hypothetical protein